MHNVEVVKYWTRGIRFYIAVGIGLFSLESWWWAESAYSGSILFATRLEELYAWVAVTLLTTAVLIGPLCSTWSKIPGKQLLYDARRLLGIGAAWFASLHVAIAYASLFKFANPLTLPGSYQRAFAAGLIALLVLLAMAFTSFDKAFTAMGRWWFRLHRFVYLAVILSLLHAFLIGSHATHLPELVLLTVVTILALSLHTYAAFFRGRRISVVQAVTMPAISIVLVATMLFGYSQHAGYNVLLGKPDTSDHSLHQMQPMDGGSMQGQSMEGMEMQQ